MHWFMDKPDESGNIKLELDKLPPDVRAKILPALVAARNMDAATKAAAETLSPPEMFCMHCSFAARLLADLPEERANGLLEDLGGFMRGLVDTYRQAGAAMDAAAAIERAAGK